MANVVHSAGWAAHFPLQDGGDGEHPGVQDSGPHSNTAGAGANHSISIFILDDYR